MPGLLTHMNGPKRRGAVAVLALVSMVVLIGMASLTVDVGTMYRARSELQVSADSAAMAGAWQLLDIQRLNGTPNMTDDLARARAEAVAYAARNAVLNQGPVVDSNSANNTNGDVLLGYLNNPNDASEPISFASPNQFNTVRVRIHRDAVRNGPVDLVFAAIFGRNTADVTAEGTATFKDGVVGFRSNGATNPNLIPLALHIDAWRHLLDGTSTSGDDYAYHSGTDNVTPGADGIREISLFPGGGGGPGQLTPGNFGTVDIGSPNNSTADISRQIRYGPNAADLAYFGGTLSLGSDGTLTLFGDTGMSAAIKDDLISIIGKPVAVPLFDLVVSPGDNAEFRVVGFAGIRIMHVRLNGAMSQKRVVIQPAYVVDGTAVTGSGPGNSSFVYEPVRLVR